MSRMSALTTFRLIGSPTNPGCPYCLPCSDCLSVERDIPTGGVGVGAAAIAVCLDCCTAGVWSSVLLPTTFDSVGAAKAVMPERHTSNRTSVVQMMADLTRG